MRGNRLNFQPQNQKRNSYQTGPKGKKACEDEYGSMHSNLQAYAHIEIHPWKSWNLPMKKNFGSV